MTRNELITELRQQARRVAEVLPAHRECLAVALQLQARGGYASPEVAEEQVARMVEAVNRTRQQIEGIEQQAAQLERQPEGVAVEVIP